MSYIGYFLLHINENLFTTGRHKSKRRKNIQTLFSCNAALRQQFIPPQKLFAKVGDTVR
jgi:hypothetical protein